MSAVADRSELRRERPSLTHAEWRAEAERRFGADVMKWRFVCPSCGYVAAVEDWQAAGAKEGETAYSCVGRHLGEFDKNTFKANGGPCWYAGGGLFGLNPQSVVDDDGKAHDMFAFEDIPCSSET